MNKYTWPDHPPKVAFPIARPGYPIIFSAAFITFVFALLGLTAPALTGILITLFICYFFRDPDRPAPAGDDILTSPADGKVIFAGITEGQPFIEGRCTKISIFMSVFNVHVNRIPFDGEVTNIAYNPGKFFSANLDKASLENEHNAVFIRTKTGADICVVQIAGLIARRIICNVSKNDQVSRGRRFGMICFGSRLDVYLPESFQLDVGVGDRVSATSSVLGILK